MLGYLKPKNKAYKDDTGAHRVVSRRFLVSLLCTLAVLSLVILFFRHSSLSVLSGLLALTIIWLGLLPGILFLDGPKTRQICLPLLSLVGVFYSVFFGLSAFLSHHLTFIPPEYTHSVTYIYDKMFYRTVSPVAQFTVISGLITMYVAHFGSTKFLWRNLTSFSLPRRMDSKVLRVGIWILLVAYLSYLYVPVIRLIPSIAQMVQPIGFLCFGGFYFLWKTDNLSRTQTILVFLILFPLAWVKLILTGLLTPLLLYFIYFLILEFWQSRKIPWVKILSALIVVGLIYPVMPKIRAHIWSPVNQISLLDTLEERSRSLGKVFIFNEKPYAIRGCNACDSSAYQRQMLYSFRGLAQRISHISVLTVVVEVTPQEVPFLNGESYRPLMTSMVPRLLWPDKPEERFGNTFGKRYGFLPVAENNTNSINTPWLTEMYANFGILGVIGGMFIVGFMIAGLERFLCHWTMSPFEQIIGASILFPLFYQDSNFSLMVGSLPLTVVTFWVFFKFVSFKSLFRYR